MTRFIVELLYIQLLSVNTKRKKRKKCFLQSFLFFCWFLSKENTTEKKLNTEIKIKRNRKRLYPSQCVRYLGIKIEQNLNWKDHINGISVKLNRANALLFKIRNFVNITILKTIYFVIFNSHINYPNLVWTQNSNAMSRIITLQKRLWELLFPNQGTVIQVL